MPVYFLRPVGFEGPVKIGQSRYPEARLLEYLKWSPVALEIAARARHPEGRRDSYVERQFHALFRHLHSHHEWFRADPAISQAIAEINAGTFDFSGLPAPRAIWSGSVRRSRETRLSTGLTRRLGQAHQDGIVIPDDVAEAAHRFSYAGVRTLADAEVVWRFLEANAPRPDARSNELIKTLMAEAA